MASRSTPSSPAPVSTPAPSTSDATGTSVQKGFKTASPVTPVTPITPPNKSEAHEHSGSQSNDQNRFSDILDNLGNIRLDGTTSSESSHVISALNHPAYSRPGAPIPVIAQAGRPRPDELPHEYKRPWGKMLDPIAKLRAEEGNNKPLTLLEPNLRAEVSLGASTKASPSHHSSSSYSPEPESVHKRRWSETGVAKLFLPYTSTHNRTRSCTDPVEMGGPSTTPVPAIISEDPSPEKEKWDNVKLPIPLTPHPIPPYPKHGTPACFAELARRPHFEFDRDGFIIKNSLVERMIRIHVAKQSSGPNSPIRIGALSKKHPRFFSRMSPGKHLHWRKVSDGKKPEPTSPATEIDKLYLETQIVLNDIRTGCFLAERAAMELLRDSEAVRNLKYQATVEDVDEEE